MYNKKTVDEILCIKPEEVFDYAAKLFAPNASEEVINKIAEYAKKDYYKHANGLCALRLGWQHESKEKQKLIDICEKYGLQNNRRYVFISSDCIEFAPDYFGYRLKLVAKITPPLSRVKGERTQNKKKEYYGLIGISPYCYKVCT